jgi:hypothetical protein
MVGAANEIYSSRAPSTTPPDNQQDGMKMLAEGLKKYGQMGGFGGVTATGSAPIAAGAGQASATGLSAAPTVIAGTPATSVGGLSTGGGLSAARQSGLVISLPARCWSVTWRGTCLTIRWAVDLNELV